MGMSRTMVKAVSTLKWTQFENYKLWLNSKYSRSENGNLILKQSQNRKDQKFVSGAPKMASFSQLPAVKKDTIFGAGQTNFRPFLFSDCFN